MSAARCQGACPFFERASDERGRSSMYEAEAKQCSVSSKGSTPSSPVLRHDEIWALAEQFVASFPTTSFRPEPWGVLTAISNKAKTRPLGPHIFLYNTEHVFGRLVKDPSCQFESLNVSAKHCTIFRRRSKDSGSSAAFNSIEPASGDRWLVFIKDSSSNGTFINSLRLKKNSPEVLVKNLDVISLVNAPEHENAFTFVYREVKSKGRASALVLKRKPIYDDECAGESAIIKRIKGLATVSSEGPVLLDDVRRLQWSNEELRKQLEEHVMMIEKLRLESQAAAVQHEAEIKELRKSLSANFLDQIQGLRQEIQKKEKEIESYFSLCAQQQSQLEDCSRSLAAASQSRKDADEIIKCQKVNIVELKEQLEDERNQHKSDREKGEADLKAATEWVRLEASEELKRQSESAACQLKEHMELISKLQAMDKDNRSLIEALRSKLDNTREELVAVERTTRSLELQLHDGLASLNIAKKKIAEHEEELQCAVEELQKEKAVKDKALAKLSAFELEMETVIQDLALEKQRLQGAQERIALRETQLREFHSTAEQIASLQKKQQEQLRAMMKVLEDGDDESHMPIEGDKLQNNAPKEFSMLKRKGLCDELVRKDSGHTADNNMAVDECGAKGASDVDSQRITCNIGVHIDMKSTNLEDAAIIGDGDTQRDDQNEQTDGKIKLVLSNEHESGPLMQVINENGCTQVLETQGKCSDLSRLIDEVEKARPESGRFQNEMQLVNDDRGDICRANRTDNDKREQIDNPVSAKMQHENVLRFGEDGKDGKEQSLEMISEGKSNLGKLRGSSDFSPEHNTGKEKDSNGNQKLNAPLEILDLMTSEVAGSWAFSTSCSAQYDNGGWSPSEERHRGQMQKGPEGASASFKLFNGRMTSEIGDMKEARPSIACVSRTSTARHDKQRRDLNAMLDIVAPDFSRLHGLNSVVETAADSDEHTQDEYDEFHGSEDSDSSHDSQPVSQSVSLSARY